MDWTKATAELSKPLSKEHVKSRSQAGRSLSYIEGWHAIAEANRIFGFNGWSRETLEVRCVTEKQRKIGRPPNERDGWGVSYVAKVSVIAFPEGHAQQTVTRDGWGAGHGIDADLGLAHESAIKEAETDAMKRALMTFGNPFGLALYDKTQANVSDDAPEPVRQSEPAPKKDEPTETYLELRATLDTIEDGKHLAMWASGVKRAVDSKQISMSERLTLSNLYEKRKLHLEGATA